ALFNDAAAKDAVDVAFAQLMPQVSFQGQVLDTNNALLRRTANAGYQAWVQLTAAKASADSTRQAIRANQIALEGVEREAIVGSRTTLDVLNAQQTLLNSRVQLVQNLA